MSTKDPRPEPGGDKRRRLEDALVFQLDERDIELLEAEEAKEDNFALRFADERTHATARPDTAGGAGAAAPDLFARIDQMQSVISILRACLPESKNVGLLESQLFGAASRAASLNVLSPDFIQYDPNGQELVRDVARIEDALIEAERKIPLSWLRHRTDEQDFGDVALAHYLRFQMQHLKIAPRSISRIDLLVSRLAAERHPRGGFRMRPPAEVADLLAACIPGAETVVHTRNAAIQFMRNASQRLDEFAHVDDIFETGFWVDILGYKLSLRYEYFDPRILYASAELSIAIETWVTQTHGVSMRTLDPQFALAREKVRKIFGRSSGDISTLTEQWNREFSSSGDDPAQGVSNNRAGASASAVPAWRTLVAVVALIIAGIYIAPTVLEYVRVKGRNLQSVSESETKAISSVLSDGSWAGERGKRIFIGHVDAGRWLLFNDEQRRAEADAIRRQLGHRGVGAGLIYRYVGHDEVLVVNIMEGEVRYIE